MGYSEITNKQFKVYSPDLGYTSRSSRLLVDENCKGDTVDLKLRNCATVPQGTSNTLNDRRGRGRPKKDSTATASQPTVQDQRVDSDSSNQENSSIPPAELTILDQPNNLNTLESTSSSDQQSQPNQLDQPDHFETSKMTNLNQQDNSVILQRTPDDRVACIEDQNRISILPHTNDLDVQKPLEIQSQKEKRKKRRTHIKT
ncbi:hypothetical protein K3495_g15597, partial [Podosphaera aphanis]